MSNLVSTNLGRFYIRVGQRFPQGIYQPRGIAVYDYPTGRKLWHYLIAPHVSRATPYITDFNGDGKLELLLGMYSPDNGGIMNDMDDSHVYLVALDNAENHLWTTEPLGGYFMCSIAAFMENSESAALPRNPKLELLNNSHRALNL